MTAPYCTFKATTCTSCACRSPCDTATRCDASMSQFPFTFVSPRRLITVQQRSLFGGWPLDWPATRTEGDSCSCQARHLVTPGAEFTTLRLRFVVGLIPHLCGIEAGPQSALVS